MIRLPFLQRYTFKRPPAFADVALLLGTFALLYVVAKVGAGFFVSFRPPGTTPNVDLDPSNLPYYAIRSSLRMFIGLFASVIFSLGYGYLAAKNALAERILVPLLDILQSIPVLGFLSITVTFFISLFPGNLFGLEMASIFAIFTGQAWNMTFSFYNSLITMPKELEEAATVFRFSKWRRFVSVELPASMIGLVWNGMMSFGGGWFFLAVSEAISVLNKSYTLPGVGSYVARAVNERNMPALFWAVVAMVVIIVIIDQLFWRPVVAWAEKFRMDRSASGVKATSWAYDLMRAAKLPALASRFWRRLRRRLPRFPGLPAIPWKIRRRHRLKINADLLAAFFLGGITVVGLYYGYGFVTKEVRLQEIAEAFGLGFLTLLRVLLLIALACVVWVPVGVFIGFNPRFARIAQPIVQICASFPANFLFPAATVVFLRLGLSIDIGSIALMALGAQWYILFNTIAGAMAVPNDLREMAASLRLSGMLMWKRVTLPAIFPFLVTGAITASGGAWNASIVSEIVTWGHKTLRAHGLGAYIADATAKGDWPRIVLGVGVMCVFVVTFNRFGWRKLYAAAETRYRLG
ncbi:MAG TPA: ABC transporter permease subunit [Fimbriimonas sp.]|nr:ABC transporter permease subunit [Fimbriimonas sp.]